MRTYLVPVLGLFVLLAACAGLVSLVLWRIAQTYLGPL